MRARRHDAPVIDLPRHAACIADGHRRLASGSTRLYLRSFTCLLVVVVLAACGSTVPGAQGAGSTAGPLVQSGDSAGTGLGAEAGGDGLGLGGAPAPAGGGAVDGAGSPVDGSAASGSLRSPGREVAAEGAPAVSRPTGAGTAASGAPRGVTAKEIHIGFSVTENQEKLNQSAGIQNGQSDQRRVIEVLTDDINRRGGIAGRRLVPVVYAFDATSNDTTAAQEQAACSHWTEDNDVFAVVINARSTDTLRTCLAKSGVEMLGRSLSESDDRTFAQFPYAEVSNPSLTRIAATTVGGLHAMGYYKPEAPTGTKVGLVRFDAPAHDRAADVFRRSLRRHNLKLDEDAAIAVPGSNAELGSFAASIQSAVLRFKTEGIDHVHLLNSDITIFFMTNAEAQNYRPQYGLNTNNGNQILAGVVPAQQFTNSLSVGWFPIVDVREADDPGLSPPAKRCAALMARHGMQESDRNAFGQQLGGCDAFNALAAALHPALGPIAPGRLMGGIDRLGRSFVSATTFATQLGPRRHDGAAVWRGLTFFDGCACFKYTTRTQAFATG